MGINFQFFPTLAALVAMVTIAITYTIAYRDGHVKKWPATDITHTMIKYPEYMVGRVGKKKNFFFKISPILNIIYHNFLSPRGEGIINLFSNRY